MLSSILVVEDDLDDVEIIQDAFNSLGYTNVTYCANASQAIHYLSSVSKDSLPNLIVTDNSIPPSDGFELVKSLKGVPQYSSIQVVVFSTFVSPQNREKLLNIGVSNVINKPKSFPEYLSIFLNLTKIAEKESKIK